jgi:WhiB family redox-sensing transcriptional regulator
MDHRSDLMSRTSWVEDWAQRGACGSSDPDALFVQGAAQQQAKTVCLGCPVIAECLADALDNRTEFGVWGGMTERQRRKLIRQHPEVKSWSAYFASRRASR